MSLSDPRELALTPSGPPRGPGAEEPSAARGDLVFIADASVEGEEVANLLRGRGYQVVDVPLALLDAQILTSPPKVLVLDVDQPRAVALAQRALSSPTCAKMTLLCVGDPLRAEEIFKNPGGDAPSPEVFERPVDIYRLVERVAAVAVPSGLGVATRGTTPPPHYARASLAPPSSDSSPPMSEIAAGVDALDVDAFLPSLDDGAVGWREALSPDLLAVLDAAEARVAAVAERLNGGPVSDEDADCPVPADMLAPLDEPLDALDESPGTGSGHSDMGDGTGSVVSATDGPSIGGRPGPWSGALGASQTGGRGGDMAPAPSSSGAGGGMPRPVTDTSQRLAALYGEGPSEPGTGAGLPPPSAMGYPLSMLGPLAMTATPVSPAIATEPARVDAPVRFQEARPVAEGRSAIARVFEDRARPTTAPAAREPAHRQAPTGRPPPTSTDRRVPTNEFLPFRPPPPASPPADLASPLAQSAPTFPPIGTFTERALWTDTSAISSGASAARPRNEPPRLEPMRYPPPRAATGDTNTSNSPSNTKGRAPGTDAFRTPSTATGSKASDAAMPMVFAELEGARPLARAIAGRYTGALVLIVDGVARRVLLHDGDIVTAASDRAEESLVAFLVERGDVDREMLPKLQSRLPASGRHAGAALIAQGYLAQDDLWPILRAHAEWIIGKALSLGPGAVELDDDPPARLRAEPSVFGGGTGAEIFVELMRRVVPASVALARLGGSGARLAQGPRATLLGECALPESEQSLVRNAAGRAVGEVASEAGADLATVLWALVELGVLNALSAAEGAREEPAHAADPLDDEAIRQKVRARASLVREGDYFSLLGVPRAATPYDIKRAYLELRRTFEPSRLLTARTVDLIEEVNLIIEVLDEAYDILRDSNRRERYRRAIEASPLV